MIRHHADGRAARLTPNPASERLSILTEDVQDAPESAVMRWEILDMSGRLIESAMPILSNDIDIDVSKFIPQLYMIRITDSSGRVEVHRFLKLE
jgi:hypothetical protein